MSIVITTISARICKGKWLWGHVLMQY